MSKTQLTVFWVGIDVLVLLSVAGCGSGGYAPYHLPYNPPYTGFSSHVKVARGTSNLTEEYPDGPTLDVNEPFARLNFERAASDYLDGVVNDLKEVNDNADNAAEKVRAVAHAVSLDFEYFSVAYVGSPLSLGGASNLGLFGYSEFPAFHYPRPTKPYKPLFLDSEFAVNSYNNRVRQYNRELADFNATIKDYIEDAEHYTDNCKNDHDEIRKKGLAVEQ
jgi:hypothetical protein